ncbi:MAG: copper amine oxidase N-terminal domain-containing protein, partial [Lachnospirales bacterium]
EKTTETTTETTTVTEQTTEVTTKDTTETTTLAETSTETTTNQTTETSTETTTVANRPSSSGGGGGGGSSYKPTTTTTTTENTTEATTEETTEETTNSNNVSKEVRVAIGSNIITIGDKEYEMDASSYIQATSNSTMVPLRFVSIAILNGNIGESGENGGVDWDSKTKTASITVNSGSGKHIIKFTVGSNEMVIDGTPVTMEYGVVAEIKDSRMYVPFRALGQALGIGVDWDSETKTAIYKVK